MVWLRFAAFAVLGTLFGCASCYAAIRTVGKESDKKREITLKDVLLCGVLTGTVTAALSQRLQPSGHIYIAMLAVCTVEFHAVTDWLCGYIYDRAVIVSAVVGLTLRLCIEGGGAFAEALLGVAAGAAPVAAVIALTRGAMGWGDATMMAGLGVIIGWKMALLTLYFGIICGGTCALILLLCGRVHRRDALPLAPFLLAGLLCALFFGQSFVLQMGWHVDLL